MVHRWGRRIGQAADWAEHARPRRPVIEAAEHPPWVGRALSDSLPMLLLVAVLGALRLLNADWAWVVFGVGCAAFTIVFYVLPWTVRIGRSFAAGYRNT